MRITSILTGCIILSMGCSDPSELALINVPADVYKHNDGSKRDTESWNLLLVISGPDYKGDLSIRSARFDLYHGDTLLETRSYSAANLARLVRKDLTITAGTQPNESVIRFGREEVCDLEVYFDAVPIAWDIDRLEVELTCEDASSAGIILTRSVPVSRYTQRTELIFPFRGPGIISQGAINNGGHSGWTNQYAVDAMALNNTYGPMATDGDSLGSFAGWGKDLIAPAAGVVIYARNDVPDTPPDKEPSEIHSALHDPLDARAGNCVIIDHGNGEWSVIMHMRMGSVVVTEGQRVEQGQAIGRVGNSGDSQQPHLHYQLQTGPILFRDPSVPVTFMNVGGALVRGRYFDAQ